MNVREQLLAIVSDGLVKCSEGIHEYMAQEDYHSAESCLKVAKQLHRTKRLLNRQDHHYRPDFS